MNYSLKLLQSIQCDVLYSVYCMLLHSITLPSFVFQLCLQNTRQRSSLLLGGAEKIQFLATLANFAKGQFEEQEEVHQEDTYEEQDEQDELIPLFKSSWCKIAIAARNLINTIPQTAATTFAFSSVFNLLLYSNLTGRGNMSPPLGDGRRVYIQRGVCGVTLRLQCLTIGNYNVKVIIL